MTSPDDFDPSPAVRFIRSNLTGDLAKPILQGLHDEYLSRYGPNDELSAYSPDAFTPPRGTAVIVTIADEVVAGGAIRVLEPGIGEIKRMWTHSAHRRQGLARDVVAWLEQQAAQLNCHLIRLETGTRQPEAIALYQSLGYAPIAGYGHHRNSPNSISLQRHIP